MYRLGDDLLVRIPRTADTARSVRKEQEWLPRLAPHLACPIPEPVHAGTPTNAFPLVWSVYRWIDGDEAGPDTVRDWAAFGADLAAIVREFHDIDLMGATRADDLSWYRGGGACRHVTSGSARVLTIAGPRWVQSSTLRLWKSYGEPHSLCLSLPEPTCGFTATSSPPTSWFGRAG
ncbi:phosphotransferase [Streptomyces sp. M2CJ-2]|uniref:phosphotransferase n=1 Tax=Streptomyces sp. M2CJ-2 TaxID=2803948 RepID=UPI0027DD8C50|nr:phosphotransferase [Streptomyces sp. M2CJ-2]